MFYEESKISDNLNCAKCQERLDDPRMLPCGDTVCSRCLSLIRVNNKQFSCLVCNEQHEMPAKGLPVNKASLALLAIQPSEVSRGRAVDKLEEKLDIMQKNITSITVGINNGTERIKEECDELRNQLQLATEQSIQQLNEHNEEMIKEVNEFEKNCCESYQPNEGNNEELIHVKELELFHSEWSTSLKQTKISDEKISKANDQAAELNDKADKEKLDLDCLIFNGSILKFTNNSSKLDKSLLGSLSLKKVISFLSAEQMTQLMTLCGFEKNQKWKLLYRATQDSFAALQFHTKCDSQPNTFIVIKSTNGNVFGGYTKEDWSNSVNYKKDTDAFIFSFINKDNKPIVMNCSNHAYAINCVNINGPTFGGGYDIQICHNSDVIRGSYSNLGHSYKHLQYDFQSIEAKSFLAGTHYFKTAEIEVYTKE